MASPSGVGKATNTREERISAKWIYTGLALLLVYAFLRSIVAAAAKPFWYDELLTQIVASQGSWQRIMTALMGPTDGQPPLFYVIEHLASRWCANQHIALRLPSAVGMVCTLWCVFLFARRRCGDGVALLCVFSLSLSCLFQYYAQEARPYSMVVALIAFAMVCYQRADSLLWAVLLGASLAMAEALHYMAVLAMVPFVGAEISETLVRRKVRLSVWIALLVGALPLAAFWKLLLLNKTYYGAHHYYGHFPFSAIPAAYGDYFRVNSFVGGAVGLAALAAVLVTASGRSKEAARFGKQGEVGETVLLFALAALPFFAFLFAKVTHSAMTARYFLSTVIGIVMAFGYVTARLSWQPLIVTVTFLLSALAISELHFWRVQGMEQRAVAERGPATRKFFATADYQELPVVIPGANTLLATVYYAFPTPPQRFVYLQEKRSADDPDTDTLETAEKGLLQVSRYVPIQVRAAGEFVAENERFLVYLEDTEIGRDRVTSRRLAEGWTVRVVANDGLRAMYLVSRGNLLGAASQ